MLIGYIRITGLQDPSTHLEALRGAGCDQVHQEATRSAAREQPALDRALESLSTADTLVVPALGHLPRPMGRMLEVLDALRQRGVNFRSLAEELYAGGPDAEEVYRAFSALAALDRMARRQRAQAGADAAQALGRRGGRPREVSEETVTEAKVLLKHGGLSAKEVAQRLGVATSTLYRLLPGGRSAYQPEAPPAAPERPTLVFRQARNAQRPRETFVMREGKEVARLYWDASVGRGGAWRGTASGRIGHPVMGQTREDVLRGLRRQGLL